MDDSKLSWNNEEFPGVASFELSFSRKTIHQPARSGKSMQLKSSLVEIHPDEDLPILF